MWRELARRLFNHFSRLGILVTSSALTIVLFVTIVHVHYVHGFVCNVCLSCLSLLLHVSYTHNIIHALEFPCIHVYICTCTRTPLRARETLQNAVTVSTQTV